MVEMGKIQQENHGERECFDGLSNRIEKLEKEIEEARNLMKKIKDMVKEIKNRKSSRS